jgi:hypothetical protein
MSNSADDHHSPEVLSRRQPALEALCYTGLGRREEVPEVLQSVVRQLREMSVDWLTNSHLYPGPLPWHASISATQPRGRLVFDEDVVLARA